MTDVHIHFWDKVRIHHKNRQKRGHWLWKSGIKSFVQVLFNTTATYDPEFSIYIDNTSQKPHDYVANKLNNKAADLSLSKKTISIGNTTYNVTTVNKHSWNLFKCFKKQEYYKLTKQTIPKATFRNVNRQKGSDKVTEKNAENAVVKFFNNYTTDINTEFKNLFNAGTFSSFPDIWLSDENNLFKQALKDKSNNQKFKKTFINTLMKVQKELQELQNTNEQITQKDYIKQINTILKIFNLKLSDNPAEKIFLQKGFSWHTTNENPPVGYYTIQQIEV